MNFLYCLNKIAIDLDNLLKAFYWIAMISFGAYAVSKIGAIEASLSAIAEFVKGGSK